VPFFRALDPWGDTMSVSKGLTLFISGIYFCSCAHAASPDRIVLKCNSLNGKPPSLITIDEAQKYVKVEEAAATFEYKDGRTSELLTHTNNFAVQLAFSGNKGRQSVSIDDDSISFSAAFANGQTLGFKIDRRTGLVSSDGENFSQCSTLPRTKQF
jgi:hypothetical protein